MGPPVQGPGREQWLSEPRFQTNAARMQHSAELDLEIEAVTQTMLRGALTTQLGEKGVPCGPVNSIADAFGHEQVVHRGLRAEVQHPQHGALPVVRSPFRFSRTPVDLRPPPQLGADTEGVLAAELGLSGAQMSALREAGVI